jgi:hypothetical protein
MLKRINITMLGTTEAGKTCYMLAMYAKMSEGVNGFTLSTDDMDMDLQLIDQWEELLYTKGQERWPEPNDSNFSYYNFNFNYALTTKIIDFNWLDYRGGALRDSKSERDVEELIQRMSNSSCIFLCIPGNILAEEVDASAMRKANIPRMKIFLKKIGGDGKTVPIAIIITKYDLCSDRKREDIIKDIGRLFEEFFVEESSWQVMICPVTLGTQLAISGDNASLEPSNFHLPLIFAIYFDYLNTMSELDIKESEALSELDRSKSILYGLNDRNWFSKTWDKISGKDLEASALDDVNRKSEKREGIKKQIAEIQDKLNLLKRELDNDDISIYIGGEEVEING